MSALRSDFRALYLYETTKLEVPWKLILPQLETMPVDEIMRQIGKTSLVVSGVFVRNTQYTFEIIASQHSNSDVSDFLYALYGLVMTCASGEIHSYLKHYIRKEWASWLFTARVDNEPVFVLACRRSLKKFVEWMADIMEDISDWKACTEPDDNGNTALHIALQRHQWDWAKWLFSKGSSPYIKNKDGKTPIMLSAPHHEKIDLFCQKKDTHWFNALHEALVHGRNDATWCVALLDRGADVNQIELYDAPLESLIVFAKHGMDMNLGELPEGATPDQLKVFYVYGHQPRQWESVISTFEDYSWVNFLHAFFILGQSSPPEEYKVNVLARQCVTEQTKQIIDRL